MSATYLASKEIEIGQKRKIRAVTPFKVIQSHPRSSRSVPIEARMRLPISDIILSRTVSEISQLIVQILDTLRF